MISNNKLIEIYNLAQKDYPKHSDQKSVHWEKYYNSKNFYSENNLINFRKNHIFSEGLDDAREDKKNKLDMLELLELFDHEFLKKNLPTKNVGNCNFSINFLGYYFDYGMVHHLKWFEEISKITFKKTKVVCEIGGGFGSLARIILKNYDVKYISIDLPEANLLSSFFLKEHYPNKKFYLYNNYIESPVLKNLDNYDIFILPPWCKFEESLKVDCFINTRSMMEMNKNIIKKYFDLIHTHITQDGFFLNINKYEYNLSTKEKICIHDYPYDNNWDVIISKTAFLQWHIHLLLTQRKFENFNNNIKSELEKIKITYNSLQEKFEKLKQTKLTKIKLYFKKKIYVIIKKILLFIFKKKLKIISRIFDNMAE